jgi:hypothetical protein
MQATNFNMLKMYLIYCIIRFISNFNYNKMSET